MSAGTETGPSLGLAPSLGHLMAELGVARDVVLDESESPFLRDILTQVTFEQHRDPAGIMAWIWGRKTDALTIETAGPEVTRILDETHRRYGIQGAVQAYGNGRWLFRWDDQG